MVVLGWRCILCIHTAAMLAKKVFQWNWNGIKNACVKSTNDLFWFMSERTSEWSWIVFFQFHQRKLKHNLLYWNFKDFPNGNTNTVTDRFTRKQLKCAFFSPTNVNSIKWCPFSLEHVFFLFWRKLARGWCMQVILISLSSCYNYVIVRKLYNKPIKMILRHKNPLFNRSFPPFSLK